MRELRPLAGGAHQIVSELAAIAIGNRNQQPAAVVAGVQQNLGDARKILSDDVGVFFGVGAESVKVDLLVEVGVFGRTFVSLRITRVVEAGAVGLPGDAAATSGEVDSRDHVRQFRGGGGGG